ncbi:hypothetical protein QTQ03_05760 [Micromonospora sp. WMMA1363]|uniref:hypothetical protein n=1 Tax=Micromonospora sp. WMMA1363 TaxID=3053985 RepID=UPI00259D19AD|nr:hypothetical protein [Micromonospora sp. WMMA1363]MDM4719125.1 hypothetical protein [Micromonospora sp. WMMA1363]
MTSPKPVKITIEVSSVTYERVRAALRFLLDDATGQQEDVRGLSELTERALIRETRRLERDYNAQLAFPTDTTPIRRGPRGRAPIDRQRWVDKWWNDREAL